MREGYVSPRWAVLFALVLIFSSNSRAQNTAPAPVGDVRPLLASLDDAVTSTRVSLAKLRIDKWKTQSEIKRRLESDAQSIERNLTQALPTLVEQLRAAPQSLSANFVMYRNLDAVHDVLNLLAQRAMAVGPEDEFTSLSTDAGRLDEVRRAFANRMQDLSEHKDAELARLQGGGDTGAKAQPVAPPKKIIVDDTGPAKKPSTPKRNSR